jgi:glycosyltransferase involved in cell wall biosynthesis
MDGGSSDNTLSVLASWGEEVNWRSEPDRGQSHALNKALGISQGEIIGWLNSDDAYLSRTAVEVAVNYFVAHPEVDVVYGHAALVNANNLILQMIWVPPFSERLLRFGNFVIQPSVFIRRTALTGKFVDEEYRSSMDRELWLRLAAEDHQFARLDRLLAVDRHYPTRKGMARPDLARSDKRRLVSTYALNLEFRHPWIRKEWKVVCRFLGSGLVAQMVREDFAFDLQRDSTWNLLFRQVAMNRAAMPGIKGFAAANGPS